MSLLWNQNVDRKLNCCFNGFGVAVLAACLAAEAYAYSPAQFMQVTSSQESQINHIRDQEIAQLKVVLGRRFSESRKPDLLLRLAELYIEQYRFYFLKENEIHQRLLQQGYKPKKLNHEKSQYALKLASEVCLAILKSHVSFQKMDQVYYFLGYTSAERGQYKDAYKYYQIIVEEYPKSNYASEAYRSLAEHAFEKGEYKEAANLFEKAAHFHNVPSYPRTLYRLAWANFKLQRYTQALSYLKKVIDQIGTDEKFVGLKEEALNDLVLFYSEAGKPDEAHDYFERISGGAELFAKVLGKLSRLYESRGEYKTALNLNQMLINEYSESRPELAFDVIARRVDLLHKHGDYKGEEAALERLVEFFSKHHKDVSKSEEALATYTRTKNFLRTRATETHKRAQKENKPALYSRAADLYAIYIRAFPGDELSEIRIYRTDCLLASGRSNEAIPELYQMFENSSSEKYRHDSGTALLNIYIKRLDKQFTHTDEEKFLEIVERFEKLFPNDSLVPELEFKVARLEANKSGKDGLSKRARVRFSEFIEKYSNRKESIESARVLVSNLVQKKELDDAMELATKFLSNNILLQNDKSGDLKKYLQSVISHDAFERVQKFEKDKNYVKAAKGYESLAAASQSDREVYFKALNNAAVNFEKAGLRDQATHIYEQVLAKFPEQSSAKQELKRLSLSLLWESRFLDAAKAFERLAKNPAYKAEEQRDFLKTAFHLYWGIEDRSSAAAIGQKYLKFMCESNKVDACYFWAMDVGSVLEESKREREAIGIYKAYVSKWGKTHRSEVHYKIGHYLEATKLSVKKNSSPSERSYAAHAAFILTEPYFEKFSKIKLELPESKLKVITKRKLKDLEDLVSRYQKVVSYGDGEWGIAALERLSDAFGIFARQLEGAPVPTRLSKPDDINLYRKEVGRVVSQMQARSEQFLKQGYQKGLELHVTTSTFIALTQRLSSRYQAQFPPAHFQLTLTPIGNIQDSKNNRSVFENFQDPSAWVEFGNAQLRLGKNKLAKLMFEQALSLNSKMIEAIHNLALIQLLEGHPLEGAQGFARALELKGANRLIKLNYAKVMSAYHHFGRAKQELTSLFGAEKADNEVSEVYAVALLGTGSLSQAGSLLEKLDAQASDHFSLWYNWSVWALLTGDRKMRQKAVEILHDRRAGLSAIEQSQVDLALGIMSRGMAAEP